MPIGDKVPDDDELWEGSVCAACGGNRVENGVFVTPHEPNCSEDDIDCSGVIIGTPREVWMGDLDDEDEEKSDTDLE